MRLISWLEIIQPSRPNGHPRLFRPLPHPPHHLLPLPLPRPRPRPRPIPSTDPCSQACFKTSSLPSSRNTAAQTSTRRSAVLRLQASSTMSKRWYKSTEPRSTSRTTTHLLVERRCTLPSEISGQLWWIGCLPMVLMARSKMPQGLFLLHRHNFFIERS